MNFDDAVVDFLSQEKIAVVGLSRDGKNPGNAIVKKLEDAAITVFAVHPSVKEIDGRRCYQSLKNIPEKIDGVLFTTHPKVTEELVEQCVALGIPRVWMHRSFGEGSVSEQAVTICEQNNIHVIAGGCPMMFVKPVDIAHKCMCWILRKTGGLGQAN